MLAESFLAVFAYRAESCESHQGQLLKIIGEESWQDQVPDMDVKGSNRLATEQTVEMPADQGDYQEEVPESPRNEPHKVALSPSHGIPRKDRYFEKEMDLYSSWSCQSLYQNYPDLHIGGDHIAADHACDSGCFMDQTSNKLPGPVLISKDIPLDIPCPLQKMKAPKFGHGDDVGEKSLVLHNKPLSNSLLNNYMETEVQELYKQFLEEKLTRCGSITHFLTSNVLMNNIGEVHHPLPYGHQQTLLHSLARLGLQNSSSGSSSEFSTPNLQISMPFYKRKLTVSDAR